MYSTSSDSSDRLSTNPQPTPTFASKVRWLTFKRGCPCCQRSYALERTPRSFLLKYILFFMPTRAFRCYNCQHTFIRIG